MKIAVVAMGKIGLPLAVQFAEKGHDVVGVDVQQRVVDEVNKGNEPFPGEAFLDEKLKKLVPAGKLHATTDYAEAIPQADAVVLVVPLFVNDETWEPDFGWMDDATRSLAAHLSKDTIISYETTLPVGTTRNRWKPLIEEISGLKEGEDFTLVFSPERVLTGRVFADLRRYPKLVGGLSAEGTAKGIELYKQLLDFDDRPDLPRPNGVWDMGTAEAAEMAKLAETTYRDVNIGLANQFGKFADKNGIDVYKVIDACNSQPYSHIHRPGIAVGGHCIPVYPRLYLWTDPDASIVRTARQANMTMPQYCVDQAASVLGDLKGQKVVVLGASYRGKVKETAFSGVFPTVKILADAGAEVTVHDPMFTDAELEKFGFTPYHIGEAVDGALLQADHPEYKDLDPNDLPGIKVLVDGRHVVDPANWQGVEVIVVGDGEDR
ncbi:MAG: nucleotide sugar dehydrogenase [Acidipropionibacterium acidipropionici]|jgi:UDP-N-acetyl-D-glucosamine dehydrogenase|uniref:Nucleotide sugar dehydrogenase n=2 Tax=Acidipropionibacterium acidipropionici TaxID=1748 RepID=A0A142KIX9_9ACTN|nr:nucleotide sugar dehydrogenase [Acidipropionibacterium acidipropionici]AFV88326.1 Nucleotide sugar dehydrogenase [Acidipropionibacterium acidipropionici ATCC 4875]ALN14304.1 nucleotide sugar dehydrogenase [Acidipropionibacterium acidipropionici]AMS06067.1 nucleotide sugar dehydrogenase [Acidipropionibacterium acidipropionici]AOZ47531.1 nucleotide sugar dehydrogenase [Acidipropionibacterium acidipropionici]APZ09933.1 nucleotide sugar dehydrogenase [Acidipropionibacterium acidipropionici]